MKNVLVRIFSGILILVCLVSLVFGALNIKDILDCKKYWETTRDEALASFDMADEGIAMLKENELAYTEGVEEYEDGKESYEKGFAATGDGASTLAAAQAQYDKGCADLAAGKAALEQGKAEVAAGEALLAANKAAYEEGKALLQKVEPIYHAAKPLYDNVNALQAQYDEAVAAGDDEAANSIWFELTAQKTLLNASLFGYSMGQICSDYEAGLAKCAEYEAGVAKVNAGKALIAQNEPLIQQAEQQIAAAKVQLDAGYQTYYGGVAKVEAGEDALAAAVKQLGVFEDGQIDMAAALELISSTDTYYNKAGEPMLPSIADRLGEDFTWWKLNEAGETLYLNGQPAVDFDKAAQVVAAGREFVADNNNVVTPEMIGRVVVTAVLMLASLVGLAAGIVGLFARPLGSAITSSVAVFFALVGVALAVVFGIECPMSRVAGSSIAPAVFAMLIVTSVAAIAHTVIGYISFAKARKAKKAEAVAI